MEIIFILFLTFSDPSIHYVDGNPTTKIVVGSPDAAAVTLWEKNRSDSSMYGSWLGKLYEVNLSSSTIKEVEIPTLVFNSSSAS